MEQFRVDASAPDADVLDAVRAQFALGVARRTQVRRARRCARARSSGQMAGVRAAEPVLGQVGRQVRVIGRDHGDAQRARRGDAPDAQAGGPHGVQHLRLEAPQLERRCADREGPRAIPDRAGTGARAPARPARPRARPAPARARRPAPRGRPATSCRRRVRETVRDAVDLGQEDFADDRYPHGSTPSDRVRACDPEASQRIGKRRFAFGKKPRSSADARGALVSRTCDGSVSIAAGARGGAAALVCALAAASFCAARAGCRRDFVASGVTRSRGGWSVSAGSTGVAIVFSSIRGVQACREREGRTRASSMLLGRVTPVG